LQYSYACSRLALNYVRLFFPLPTQYLKAFFLFFLVSCLLKVFICTNRVCINDTQKHENCALAYFSSSFSTHHTKGRTFQPQFNLCYRAFSRDISPFQHRINLTTTCRDLKRLFHNPPHKPQHHQTPTIEGTVSMASKNSK